MKLIIEDIIKISKEYLEDDFKEILKEFTILYKEDEEHIFIEQQKISLNETQVNTLFCDFFEDNVEIKYAYLGGRGCDLSLSLYNKVKG